MNKLQALGLVETTSQRQRSNGTRRFHDPITNCDYLSYESGYVRRSYVTKFYLTGQDHRTIYQLNKTRMGIFVSPSSGNEYECTERIMIPFESDRLERLAHCVVTFRNNKIIQK